MKGLACFVSLLLVACGGGSPSFDPVTHVSLVDDVPGPHGGYSWWGDGGSRVEVVRSLDSPWRLRILVHEVWHLLTREGAHPNACPCVSSSEMCPWPQDEIDGGPPVLCPEEVAQAVASGRTVTLSFPADPACALAAAEVWNDACGLEIVRVAP